MPIQHTTEFAVTSPEVIRAIRDELQSSPRKHKVFEAIYGGGNKPKNAKLLASKTNLSEITILQLATPMAHKQYFEKVQNGGRVAFKKYPHINAVKHLILKPAKAAADRSTSKTKAAPTPSRFVKAQTPQSSNRNNDKRSKARARRDVFVSHATEDKDFVAPLVRALETAGISVWYDQNVLEWGDDLRSSIDRGLASSRYGIVVFSKSFLKGKHWTEHELNGLFAKERAGKTVILPIWHKITQKDLLKYSPAFADRIAKVSQKDAISDIVKSLKAKLRKR